TTPTSTRTCSASQPRPTTRLRPFRNRISTRASSDPCGSGARSTTSDPLPAERRHTLRAPPLRANQPPPLRSRSPAPFSLRHCASLPAIRHSAPLHLAHTRCPSPIAHGRASGDTARDSVYLGRKINKLTESALERSRAPHFF